MTTTTPVPQTCATCAHASVPEDKMQPFGFLMCAYLTSSDYRSPVRHVVRKEPEATC